MFLQYFKKFISICLLYFNFYFYSCIWDSLLLLLHLPSFPFCLLSWLSQSLFFSQNLCHLFSFLRCLFQFPELPQRSCMQEVVCHKSEKKSDVSHQPSSVHLFFPTSEQEEIWEKRKESPSNSAGVRRTQEPMTSPSKEEIISYSSATCQD